MDFSVSERIAQILVDAPPLSEEKRATLTVIFQGGGHSE